MKQSKFVTPEIENRINSLTLSFVKVASKLSAKTIDRDINDITQIMYTALLERAKKDPTFFEQSDGYIVKYAELIASHKVRDTFTYLRYVDEDGVVYDPQSASDEDSDMVIEDTIHNMTLQQAKMLVEKEVMMDELGDQIIGAVSKLSVKNQTVVKCLYLGYKPVEIACFLGISKGALSQRMNTIQKEMGTTLFGWKE